MAELYGVMIGLQDDDSERQVSLACGEWHKTVVSMPGGRASVGLTVYPDGFVELAAYKGDNRSAVAADDEDWRVVWSGKLVEMMKPRRARG